MKTLSMEELSAIQAVAGGKGGAHDAYDKGMSAAVGRLAGVAATAFVDGFVGAYGATWWSGGVGALVGIGVGIGAGALALTLLELEDSK